MSEIRPIIIIIESVQGPPVGLADAISYTCTLVFDDGERRPGVSGVRPIARWPAPIQIDAAPPRGTPKPDGTYHEGIHLGVARGPSGAEVLSAFITEYPHCEPCA